MGILLGGLWMLHHDIGQGEKKDAVLLALTIKLKNLSLHLLSNYAARLVMLCLKQNLP